MIFSTCVGRSAASDEAQVLSGSMAIGIEEEEEKELVLKTGFTLDACGHCSETIFFHR